MTVGIDQVSVIVPVGRVDAPLQRQLDALRGQQAGVAVEFVLARNVADPEEGRRLDAMVSALADERFRVVAAADRRGAAHARNAGAALAKGDVLAFCDSDDIVREGWLESIVGALDEFDAVGGRLIDVGLSERFQRARPPSTPDRLPTFLGVPYMGSGNMAIRRAVFEDVGGFDENLVRCEDIAFSWQLIAKGYRVGFASDACVEYQHRPGTLPMMRQHFSYGRGMAQVLSRYGVPDDAGWSRPQGARLLRPNSGTGGQASLLGVLRRGALAAGRIVGVLQERRRAGVSK